MRRFARYLSTRAFSFALPLVLGDMAPPCTGGCDSDPDRPPESAQTADSNDGGDAADVDHTTDGGPDGGLGD